MMADDPIDTPMGNDRSRRIRSRNRALLLVLLGLVALFYALTIVRMGVH